MGRQMSGPEQGPVVITATGAVRGRTSGGVHSFLGVPYAAPLAGSVLLGPPQPVAPWDGTRQAAEYGPTAPKGDYPPQYQKLFPEENIAGDEFLNLNVWTPDPGAAGLPVLVWIHGGSFMNGSGSVGAYDGTAFARSGVVCVTINYRLAATGFLYVEDGPANLGLLDQLAALRWVQDNIAAFGGDPARVTVAGESAGAMSVTTLLSMPRSAGLFAQAIAQSGAAAHALDRDTAQMVAGHLAAALGVTADGQAIAAVPLDRLIGAASDLVVEVQTAPDPAKWGSLAMSLLPFAPVVDGDVLPRQPLEAIAAGQGGGVPLLIGSNREEARLFLVAAGTIGLIDDDMLSAAAGAYGLNAGGLAVYRAARPDASPGDVLAAVITDWFFAIPAVRVAEARGSAAAAASTVGSSFTPTWVYRFDHPAPEANRGLGACHAVEIPFVFGTTDRDDVHELIGDQPSPAVADAAHRTWVSFITGGSPGWSPYSADKRLTGVLTETVTEVPDPDGDERALWESIR
jgi:para-nitrobenzyl esterase